MALLCLSILHRASKNLLRVAFIMFLRMEYLPLQGCHKVLVAFVAQLTVFLQKHGRGDILGFGLWESKKSLAVLGWISRSLVKAMQFPGGTSLLAAP